MPITLSRTVFPWRRRGRRRRTPGPPGNRPRPVPSRRHRRSPCAGHARCRSLLSVIGSASHVFRPGSSGSRWHTIRPTARPDPVGRMAPDAREDAPHDLAARQTAALVAAVLCGAALAQAATPPDHPVTARSHRTVVRPTSGRTAVPVSPARRTVVDQQPHAARQAPASPSRRDRTTGTCRRREGALPDLRRRSAARVDAEGAAASCAKHHAKATFFVLGREARRTRNWSPPTRSRRAPHRQPHLGPPDADT